MHANVLVNTSSIKLDNWFIRLDTWSIRLDTWFIRLPPSLWRIKANLNRIRRYCAMFTSLQRTNCIRMDNFRNCIELEYIKILLHICSIFLIFLQTHSFVNSKYWSSCRNWYRNLDPINYETIDFVIIYRHCTKTY